MAARQYFLLLITDKTKPETFFKNKVFLFQNAAYMSSNFYTFYMNNRKKVKILHLLHIQFTKITSINFFILKQVTKSYKMSHAQK